MVTFSCDLCADIVKKPKTPQHLYRCPDAQFTCIDCFTTFHGDNYLYHTSCISEAEKYQKGLYKGNKKGKQDTPNKQKHQKVGSLNNINKQSLEGGEQSNTLNNNSKALKSSEQDQIPNTIADNKNHSQDKKKRKNKNKKNLHQDNQPNGNKIINKGEKEEEEKDIAAKATNNYDNEAQDATIKQEDNNTIVNSSTKKKRKNKRSINNINGNDCKVEESKKNSNNVIDPNESQSFQTYVANETQKKEKNVENFNNSSNSSSKKKKKKRKNDSINKNNNNLENPNGINGIDQSLVGILKKKESSEGKDRKRKSVEFMLPELSTNNKKKKTKKSKFSHENDLSNYYESIPAVVKKIFKSNNYEELNLKRLEEMVVHQLISGSNSSESELKEKFLENIVLTMKDGKIILK